MIFHRVVHPNFFYYNALGDNWTDFLLFDFCEFLKFQLKILFSIWKDNS